MPSLSRIALAKREAAAESAAFDARTAKLRALRLAKEAQDAEAARAAPVQKDRATRGE